MSDNIHEVVPEKVSVKIGGKEYSYTKMTYRMYGEIADRLKTLRLANVKDAKAKAEEMKKLDTKADTGAITTAIKEYMSPITDTDLFMFMVTLKGTTYKRYLILKNNNAIFPYSGFDEFADKLTQADMVALNEADIALSPPEKTEEEKELSKNEATEGEGKK